MSSLFKNLLIALGITLILGVGYYMLTGSDEDSADLTNGAIPSTSPAAQQIEMILADTQKINSYKIEGNQSILMDRRFTSLVNRQTEIPEVSSGRENPFAPLQ